MWCLRSEVESPPSSSKTTAVSTGSAEKPLTQDITATEIEKPSRSLSIACDGSVINKYPGFKDQCQAYLDLLAQQTAKSEALDASTRQFIILELAPDSPIFGAAVAVAIALEAE